MVFIGFKTVYQGQKALVQDIDGNSKVVEGPKRVFLFRSSLKRMELYCAAQGEYLQIQYMNGNKVVLPGPVSV